MGEQQPVAAGRIQMNRAQRGSAADEAVHQHGDALLRTCQVGADQCGNLEAAQAAQRFEWLVAVGAMQRQRAVDHLDLAGDTLRVQPRAGADQRAGWFVEQRAGQRSGGTGVADTHLAADEQLGAGLLRAAHGLAAGFQGDQALRGGHRRLLGEVRRTGADHHMQHTRQRLQRRCRAEVDDLQARIEVARQHADRRAAAHEVAQHLDRHCLRIGRYTLGHHPVVTGEQGDPDMLQARPLAALQAGQADGFLFQPASAPRGLVSWS